MVDTEKQKIYEKFDSMQDGVGDSQLDANGLEKLILACRILSKNGHCEGLAGQVTCRDKGNLNHYRTVQLAKNFSEVTVDDVCLFDDDLNVLDKDLKINPALRFHSWLYRSRPDVQAIIHTHAPHASALSMIGVPLKVSHMDTVMFYDDCAYLETWPGVPVGDEEGKIISSQIGDKKSIFLAHHGFIATGVNIEEATYLAINFDRAARLQLLAMAAGTIKDIEPDLALDARNFLLKPAIVQATFEAWCRQL